MSQKRLRGKGCVVPSLLLVYSSIMTEILRNEFNRLIEQLTCEELRQSVFTEEFKVADRLLTLSEKTCCEFVFPLFFDLKSRKCNISFEMNTELIKQLLKLYEISEKYRERLNWLEEDSNDSCNSSIPT